MVSLGLLGVQFQSLTEIIFFCCLTYFNLRYPFHPRTIKMSNPFQVPLLNAVHPGASLFPFKCI